MRSIDTHRIHTVRTNLKEVFPYCINSDVFGNFIKLCNGIIFDILAISFRKPYQEFGNPVHYLWGSVGNTQGGLHHNIGLCRCLFFVRTGELGVPVICFLLRLLSGNIQALQAPFAISAVICVLSLYDVLIEQVSGSEQANNKPSGKIRSIKSLWKMGDAASEDKKRSDACHICTGRCHFCRRLF